MATMKEPGVDFRYYPDIADRRDAVIEVLQRRKTPVFICERENLVSRFRELDQSLRRHWSHHAIAYSLKTNYLVAQSGIFRELGGWAEVVSGREYRQAREWGYPGRHIVFNGPHKTDEELERAFAEEATVHVNDPDELQRILSLAQRNGKPIEVGLRLAAELPQWGQSRFGFSLENGEAAVASQSIAESSRVRLVGLHMHLYADTDDPELYRAAARRMGDFIHHRLEPHRAQLKWIDLGGGFPAHGPKPYSRFRWDPQPIDVYIAAAAEALRSYFPGDERQPVLIVEPGRFLTADGIIFVSRVVHVRHREGRQHVTCDGSVSMMPLTHYCPQLIRAYDPQLRERTTARVATTLYGSSCRENDILYKGEFPQVAAEDYLIHFAAGAYNSSLSPDFIFEPPGMAVI